VALVVEAPAVVACVQQVLVHQDKATQVVLVLIRQHHHLLMAVVVAVALML